MTIAVRNYLRLPVLYVIVIERPLFSYVCVCYFDHGDNLDGHSDKKEIIKQSGLLYMEYILIIIKLHWTGHLIRMSPNNLPKQMIYSHLSSGQM